MGTGSSSLSDLSSNPQLLRLAGTECLSVNDPFWNQLLSFTFIIPRNSVDQGLLEEATVSVCKNFVVNNGRTANLSSLIRVFLIRADELKVSAQCHDAIFTWQAYNALFIIRNLIKYFVDNLTEDVVLEQFRTVVSDGRAETSDGTEELLDEFLDCLTAILVDVPVVDETYAVHVECINVLITLLSIQLSHPDPLLDSKIYRHIVCGKCCQRAGGVVQSLLSNYVRQLQCPAQLQAGQSQHGVLRGVTSAIASGLWTMVTLGLANQRAAKSGGAESSEPLLANQSVLLLLVLTNHCCVGGVRNPYREAFFSCTDTTTSAPSTLVSVSYAGLYSTLCSTLNSQQTTLLLYMLLHRVESIHAFILSRTNIDQLLVPLLKLLYHAPDGTSHHLNYMALIVILILSEDACFSKSVHEIPLKNISWFRERHLSELSLGGLLILVLVRTIQYNLTRLRDQYLHTNCLAALANMSAQFSDLHPYVSQRLVNLFASLLKKYSRVSEKLHNVSMNSSTASSVAMATSSHVAMATSSSVAVTGSSHHDNDSSVCIVDGLDDTADLAQEVAVVEEVMRMLLEIFNSCLSNSLHHNPNLVYTMLYQRALFTQLLAHSTFQDIVANIDLVLSYFTLQLDRQTSGGSASVHEVQAVIRQSAVLFKRERLKKFAELKFRYVEEERPEEFFVPYVWSLVYHESELYFNPGRIHLFTAQPPTTPSP